MEVGTKIPDDPVMGMREKIGAMSERVDRMRLACTYLLEERRDDQKHLGKGGTSGRHLAPTYSPTSLIVNMSFLQRS